MISCWVLCQDKPLARPSARPSATFRAPQFSQHLNMIYFVKNPPKRRRRGRGFLHGPHMRSAPSVHAAKAQQAQALCTALLRTHNVRFEYVGKTCVVKTCVDNAETCGANSLSRNTLCEASLSQEQVQGIGCKGILYPKA